MTEKFLYTTEKILKTCRAIVALTAFAGLFITVSVNADAQLRYGFRFGGDFAKASLGNAYTMRYAVPPNTVTDPPIIFGQNDGVPSEGPSLVNRSGFSGGLVLEYQFEKCGFAPDIALLYTRYNTRLALPEEKPRSFGRNFIEVPIHFKWKFWIPQTKNLFAPMIYTGPSFMFRVGYDKGLAYSKKYLFTLDDIDNQSPDNVYYFCSKVFQPGWDVGIGFDVINFIQITAGYRFGLGDALDTPSAMSLRTNAWNLSATILFDF